MHGIFVEGEEDSFSFEIPRVREFDVLGYKLNEDGKDMSAITIEVNPTFVWVKLCWWMRAQLQSCSGSQDLCVAVHFVADNENVVHWMNDTRTNKVQSFSDCTSNVVSALEEK